MSNTFQDWRLVVGGHLAPHLVAILCAGAVLAVVLSAIGLFRGPRRGPRAGLIVLRILGVTGCLLAALEPAFELRQMTRVKNHVAVLVDDSLSMGVKPPTGGKSRAARAAEMVARAAERIAELRARGHVVDLYRFSASLSPALPDDLARTPQGGSTRLGETLDELKSRYAGRDLGALFILSDGIDTGRVGTGPLDAETRKTVTALAAPIHTVFIGEDALKDLSIATVLNDDFSFVRTPIKLEAIVRHSGLAGRQVEVSLTRDGRLIDARTVALEATTDGKTGGPAGDQGETKVSFPFTPQQPGNFMFEISTPVLQGEALASNNRQAFTLKVIRDRVRVLHVAGRPSWDQRFLRSLLRLDPNVDLVSFFILRTEHDDPPWNRDDLSLIPFPHREIFDEQLHTFDLLIFQNFNYGPYQVSGFLPGIRDYVMGGGALAMVGGDLSFAAGGYGSSALNEILPVDLGGVPGSGPAAFSDGRYRPKLTTEGGLHPVTALSLSRESNEKRWAALPALSGLNRVARLQPGATALMNHPSEKSADGQPAPVLASANVGKGRSLALLTDSAWAWGFGAAGEGDDGRSFQRFWDAAIRWLVRDPALTLLRLDIDQAEIAESKPISVRVRTLQADYTAAADIPVKLEVLTARNDGEAIAAREPFDLRTSTDGEAHIEVPPLPVGAYRLRAQASIEGRALVEEKTFVVRPEGLELDDVIARGAVLRELASLSGGEFFDNEFGAGKIRPLREERLGRHKAIELGGHPALLLVSLALLSAEWALRRKRGYR